MPKRIKAVFVRHSESTGNEQDVVKGTKDYPLDSKGKRESVEIAKQVARYKPSVVLTSPLKRATEPARKLAARAGVKVVVDRGLLPTDFGDLTGESRKTGEPKIRRMALESPDKKFPGGESTNAWAKKNDAAMGRVKDIIAKGGRPAVITHSRNLTRLPKNFQGAKGFQDPTKPPVKPGGIVTLDGKKKLVIHSKGV
jgi:broad specificity phosphatase PhoE